MPQITKRYLTPLQVFKEKWEDCTACALHKCRNDKAVLCRGTYPCDVVFVGEAPGHCITGDTLIETAYRDKSKYPDGIPVKDLVGKSGFKVFSYDHENCSLSIGVVKNVQLTGFKQVYKVAYSWWGAPKNGKGGRKKYYGSVTVTDNHQFLLFSGAYRSLKQGLKIGTRLRPFYRYLTDNHSRYRVGLHSTKMVIESRFLMEDKIGRKLVGDEEVHHDNRNPLDDSQDNIVLLTCAEHARIHGLEDNVMYNQKHLMTHKIAMLNKEYRKGQSKTQKKKLADPFNYYHFLKTRKFGQNQNGGMGRHLRDWEVEKNFRRRFPGHPFPPENENHRVVSITPMGVQAVYDLEVEKYHNFVANGVFVHNSEDILGIPMCGPAGQLQDRIIAESVPKNVTFAITNLVCCIPLDDTGKKTTEPDDEYIEACTPRFQEFIELCQPSLIVAVGKLSYDFLDPKYKRTINHLKIPTVHTLHPAYILRVSIAVQELKIRECIITIRDAIEQYITGD